jgi:hypothetical protein
MKRMISISVSFYLMTSIVFAQSPMAFKYQAVARTSSGNLITNQLVAFRISVLQGSPSGTLLYQERHTTNTNNYGLANLDIGNGTVLSGIFSSINWSLGQMYIKVELDPLGGTSYQNMGTTQLLSVPYALHSMTSDDLTLPFAGSLSYSGNAFSVTNSGNGNAISGIASSTSSVLLTGVYGESAASFGIGVDGHSSGAGATLGMGVRGVAISEAGVGVYGLNNSNTGTTKGIWGNVFSDDGYSGYFTGGRFYVDGNVGIGTTSPSRTLSVKVGTGISSANFINDASGSLSTDGLMIGLQGTLTASLMNYENASMVLGTNNTARLTIQSNGLIGIGTLVPAYLLDVTGPANLNKGISGVALRCDGDEALWYNGTYFSWGYAGTYNFFGNKLKIAGNGNTAPTYELQVDGNAAKSLGGSTWIVSSDLRLKNMNGNYTKGLNEIIALQPVRFSYKAGNSRGLPSNVEQVGFVAQEVQKVFPEAVNESEDGLLDFNMHPLNVALINAIKELKAENDQLKAENEKINARLEKIETVTGLSAAKIQ